MKSIGKNFFFLSSAEITSKILGFLTTAYLARRIGVDGFGDYGFVVAVYAYLALIANPGYDIVGTREIVHSEKEQFNVFNSLFLLKSGSTIVSFIILLLICLVVPFSSTVKQLLMLQSLMLFTIPFTFQFFFRGNNQMHIVAISRFAQSVLYFLFVFLGVRSAEDLPRVPVFFAISSAFALIPMVWILKKNFVWFRGTQWEQLRAYFVSAVTVGAASMCIQVYLNLDTVLLGVFRTNHEVGIYISAYKIVTLASAIPSLLFASYLPYLISIKSTETKEWKKFVLTMFTIGLPTGIIINIYAPELTTILYGKAYDSAVIPLRILSFDIIAVFISITFAQPLLLLGEEKKYLSIVACSAGLNLLLNLFMIPWYGMIGAAITTVLAESLVAFRSWKAIKRKVESTFIKEISEIVLISGTAVLLMFLCMNIFHWNLTIAVISFIIFYSVITTYWYSNQIKTIRGIT